MLNSCCLHLIFGTREILTWSSLFHSLKINYKTYMFSHPFLNLGDSIQLSPIWNRPNEPKLFMFINFSGCTHE